MKRREFLAATAGLTGTIFPLLSKGQSKPCPPETVAVAGGSGSQVSCGAPGSAPSWFVGLPEKTWTRLAIEETINAASAGQAAASLAHNDVRYVTKAYTGAVVDQSRGEYLMAANGGHANYDGNEVYAIQIKSDNPRWYRLTERSPASVVNALLIDGTQSSSNTTSEQGNTPPGTRRCTRMDECARSTVGARTSLPMGRSGIQCRHPRRAGETLRPMPGVSIATIWVFRQPTGRTPLAWANNAGPFTWLGASRSGSLNTATTAEGVGTAPMVAYDPVSQQIFCAHGRPRLAEVVFD